MSSTSLPEAVAPLKEDPQRGAVLLDIDGTLAPIVEHASDAHVHSADRVADHVATDNYAGEPADALTAQVPGN